MKKLFYLLVLFTIPNFLSATNYYWVGGTGAWSDYANHWATSSGGTVFHVQIPTPSDDVFFDANSFSAQGDSLNVDTTFIYCRNLDFSGALYSPTVIGGNINMYGSLTLVNNMILNGYMRIHLLSSAAGNTLITSGHAINQIYFEGTGSWTLGDELTVGQININNGIFRSNNFNISCGEMSAGSNGTALLGTSVVTLSGSLVNFDLSGFTLDADSADFVFTNYGNFMAGSHTYHDVQFNDTYGSASLNANMSVFHNVTFASNGYIQYGSNIFNKVIFAGNASIRGSNTFDTLIFNNPGINVSLNLASTQTIVDALIADGTCGQPITFQSSQDGMQATIIKSSGTVTCSYLILKDMNASGGAAFVANNSVDLGNNNGWTINSAPPRNLYWTGGTGSWSDPAHWSLTSGGSGGNCPPSFSDNVFFDNNSFAQINDSVSIDVAYAYCKDMDFSGALYSPSVIGGNINLYGSLTLVNNMILSGYMRIHLLSSAAGNTLITSGHAINQIYFEGTGSWSLGDELNVGQININNGIFRSNDFNISCGEMSAGSNGTALLGTSVVTLSGSLVNFDLSGFTLDADSADFVFTNYGNFLAGSHTYHDVQFNDTYGSASLNANMSVFHNVTFASNGYIQYGSNIFNKVIFAGNASIRGSNTFDTLIFNNPGINVSLNLASTQTIVDALIADGTCGQPITFQSSQDGMQATIIKSSGTVTCSYLILKDMNASGGAAFVANNSVDLGNNNGWTINSAPPRNLYWTGGTGSWSDPAHWSLTSGGSGGNCPPSFSDNVFFDNNSFAQINDSVSIDVAYAYCKDMDFSGALYSPSVIGGNINLYGSLTLVNNMILSGYMRIHLLSSAAGNTLITSGHAINQIYFEGTGSWSLGDELNVGQININNGIFRSNDFNISCGEMSAGSNGTALLGTSVVTLSGSLVNFDLSGFTLDADSADFVFTNYGNFLAGSHTYHDVQFNDTYGSASLNANMSVFHNVTFASNGIIQYGSNIFNKVIFAGNASILGSNTFDTLTFINPGSTVNLQSPYTTTIGDYLQIQGDPGFPISIQCISGSATLSQSSGSVCTDYIYLQNIIATGGAQFYAGDHSVDLGGNSGWNWTRCVPLISNVWPGDCNYDLIADNLDLLNIGVAFGDTGFVRPAASLAYVAQPCQDWYWQFINAVNVKHADCDGNGIVDFPDTTAISLNYGQVHPPRPNDTNQVISTGTDLILQLPASAVAPGSVISAPILLGTSGNPANNIYGIAFTIDYDSMFIQPGTMSVDFTGSWVATAGNYLHLQKDFPFDGKTDVAFTRYNHTDISGYGLIGTLNFTVSNTATGILAMSFSRVKIISHNEINVPVVPQSTSMAVGVDEINNQTHVSLFPNPAHNELFLITGELKSKEAVIIVTDITGREMFRREESTGNSNWLNAHLDLAGLNSGIYFIRVETDKEHFVEKFVKE